MKSHIGRDPKLCRNSWGTFGGEQLPGLWNKVVSAVVLSALVIYCQIGNLGAVSAVRGARTEGQFAFPEWQLISQREGQQHSRDSVGTECAPLSGERWEGFLFFFFFEGVQWNRRSFCKEGVMYREGLTALAKEHLHSLQCVASTAQRSLFSVPCRESVDPSSASHKCLHL